MEIEDLKATMKQKDEKIISKIIMARLYLCITAHYYEEDILAYINIVSYVHEFSLSYI